MDYILEEFIPGRIITYDGLTDLQGNVVFDSSLEYSKGVMEVVNQDTDIYYYMVRRSPKTCARPGARWCRPSRCASASSTSSFSA